MKHDQKNPQNNTEKPQQQVSRKREFYPQLKNLIESIGEWNISISALSREWAMPRQTLSRWKKQIIQELGPVDIESAGRNISQTVVSNIKQCQRLLKGLEDPMQKMQAMKIYNELIRGFIEFLEAMGYKPKVAERVEASVGHKLQLGRFIEKLKEREKLKNEKESQSKNI